MVMHDVLFAKRYHYRAYEKLEDDERVNIIIWLTERN